MEEYKKLFSLYLSLLFVFVLFFLAAVHNSPVNNSMAEWVINYQGGLVRRGLIGEIFYKIHHYTGIDLDLIVLASVYILFVINAHILIKSANLIKDSYTDILIFLSPGFFLYNTQIIS